VSQEPRPAPELDARRRPGGSRLHTPSCAPHAPEAAAGLVSLFPLLSRLLASGVSRYGLVSCCRTRFLLLLPFGLFRATDGSSREKAFIMRIDDEEGTDDEDDSNDEAAQGVVVNGARFWFNDLESR
jgi:hypothetical protein